MARIGVSITKSTPYRGSAQEFSNVYHYESIGGLPSVSEADSIIDELTAAEKQFHSDVCTFVRGRLWSQQGSPATNEMISQKNLSGTGIKGTDTSMDKERAFLFRIRAGNDSRGNPVYLRKWYHVCCAFSSTSNSASLLQQTTSMNQTTRDSNVALMNTVGAVGGGTEPWKLCSKSGRFPTAGQNWSCHAYLEHRQLGDMWRAT